MFPKNVYPLEAGYKIESIFMKVNDKRCGDCNREKGISEQIWLEIGYHRRDMKRVRKRLPNSVFIRNMI